MPRFEISESCKCGHKLTMIVDGSQETALNTWSKLLNFHRTNCCAYPFEKRPLESGEIVYLRENEQVVQDGDEWRVVRKEG